MNRIKTAAFVIITFSFLATDMSARQGGIRKYMNSDDGQFQRPKRRGMMGRGMMGRGMMGKGMMGGRCYGDRDNMKRNLKLTEKQIIKIGQINGKYKTKLINFRDKLFPKKQKLRGFLLNKKVNFDKLKLLLKDISDIEIEIRMIKIMQRLEIEKVLTLNQKTNLRNERRLDRY